jgi:hypothetical protein
MNNAEDWICFIVDVEDFALGFALKNHSFSFGKGDGG